MMQMVVRMRTKRAEIWSSTQSPNEIPFWVITYSDEGTNFSQGIRNLSVDYHSRLPQVLQVDQSGRFIRTQSELLMGATRCRFGFQCQPVHPADELIKIKGPLECNYPACTPLLHRVGHSACLAAFRVI